MKDWRIKLDFAFAVALALTAIIALCSCKAVTTDEATCEPTTAATTEEPTEVITEAMETEAHEATPPVILYAVPLEADLQLHIIETAEAHGIDPAIIFAMAFYESTYRTDVINNSGCFGLLQIKKSCHRDRMKRLGCTDLLDPYQNVTVAVDYLAEQIDRYNGDLAKGLTAYNRGHYAGTITYYAKSVMSKAEGLRGETYAIFR